MLAMNILTDINNTLTLSQMLFLCGCEPPPAVIKNTIAPKWEDERVIVRSPVKLDLAENVLYLEVSCTQWLCTV